MPKYAVFTTKIKNLGGFRLFCRLAYDGITWHIFFFISSKKGSKIEKIFNFTTRKI